MSKGEIISNIVHNNMIYLYIKYVRTRCLYVVIETAGPPSLKSVGKVALKDNNNNFNKNIKILMWKKTRVTHNNWYSRLNSFISPGVLYY